MKFLNPEEVLRQFKLYGALEVADFGVGGGHLTIAAAKRLEGGKLYAVDIDEAMLTRVVHDARERGHKHVHPVRGDLAKKQGVPLKEGVLDRALLVNTLFSAHDRDLVIQEIKRMLKPGGRVLFIEWADTHTAGPHHKHKVPKESALSLFVRHGFKHEGDIDAGDYHYGMILER